MQRAQTGWLRIWLRCRLRHWTGRIKKIVWIQGYRHGLNGSGRCLYSWAVFTALFLIAILLSFDLNKIKSSSV
jgi:hypothetical protein